MTSQKHGTQVSYNSTVPATTFSSWQQQKRESFPLLVLCEGNPPGTGGLPHKEPVKWNAFPCHDIIVYFLCFVPRQKHLTLFLIYWLHAKLGFELENMEINLGYLMDQ